MGIELPEVQKTNPTKRLGQRYHDKSRLPQSDRWHEIGREKAILRG